MQDVLFWPNGARWTASRFAVGIAVEAGGIEDLVWLQSDALNHRYEGHTALSVDESGWRLVE